MSILRIRTIGDPVLRTPAQEVTQFDESLETLIRDMFETMYAVGGVGLAAPQVGVGLQIFTWGIQGDEGYAINPHLELGDDPQEGGEGCLSVPGLSYETPRRERAVLTALDVHGEPVSREATGLLARCFQHETAHLRGMLYVDRLVGEQRKDAMRQLRQASFGETAARITREREEQRLGGAAHSTGDDAARDGSGAQPPRRTGAAFGAPAGIQADGLSRGSVAAPGSSFGRGGAR